jgi:hypothetical protein
MPDTILGSGIRQAKVSFLICKIKVAIYIFQNNWCENEINVKEPCKEPY